MRIGFDLDGVLADLHTPFVRKAVELFPEIDSARLEAADIGASPTDDEAGGDRSAAVPDESANVVISSRQSAGVWRAVAKSVDFWESLDEIESGMIRRLATLADERRWEILFITSRPRSAGRTVQRQSQRWLERHGFPLPSVYVVHGSRGKIAAALNLDVVVDDRPDNCLDVSTESQAGSILVWRGAEGRVPASARRLGIAVVSSVSDCLDKLVAADEADSTVSLVDRIRRIFGLKARSASGRRVDLS